MRTQCVNPDDRAGPACHSIELARAGAEVVYAVELAESMVVHARAKAAAAGVSLHLIQGDMESFQLPVRHLGVSPV